jgi:cytochrome c553
MNRIAVAAMLVLLSAVGSPRFHAPIAAAGPSAGPDGSGALARRCAACHLPNGFGRPDTASLAGLPAVYIAEQMADYRRGARTSPPPPAGQTAGMWAIAAVMTDDEARMVGQHFASIPYRPWIRVVETDTASPTINEVPGEAGSGFVAYVPPGSIHRGEALVTTGGGGRTVRCALCHGADLRGLGPVPAIAGRSPSYQMRQLSDMQKGLRHGLGSDLMRATVARLTEGDMIAIAAYVASGRP